MRTVDWLAHEGLLASSTHSLIQILAERDLRPQHFEIPIWLQLQDVHHKFNLLQLGELREGQIREATGSRKKCECFSRSENRMFSMVASFFEICLPSHRVLGGGSLRPRAKKHFFLHCPVMKPNLRHRRAEFKTNPLTKNDAGPYHLAGTRCKSHSAASSRTIWQINPQLDFNKKSGKWFIFSRIRPDFSIGS